MSIKSILIVCRGNICRSPMAEGFFSHQLRQNNSPITVSSAGISALVNYPADPNAQITMSQYSIDISQHRAQQLNESLVRKTDLILVMTLSQLNIVAREFLTAKGKTFLLGYWQGFEIEDPYKQSNEKFEKVYQQIKLAWQEWKTRILPCQIYT